MNRPLSNAKTTFMPELHPATVPIAVANERRHCAWCGIPLSAVPDPYRVWNGRRYHPGDGCVGPAQIEAAASPLAVDSLSPGTSDPR